MNVRQYFEQTFPGYPDAESKKDLESMPLDSPCGDDCRVAIDAGSILAQRVRMAYGHSRPAYISNIADVVVDVCGCYIRG